MASLPLLAGTRRPSASLTLLTRALREDNRLKQGYLARTLVLAFVLLVMYETRRGYSYSGAPGLTFFSNVIGVNLFFLSIAGLAYFAGAITEEKEEGTLGLLRMTGMSALSILLGKSTSRLCNVILLLVAQVPFTLLAVTLGGVSNRQVLAVYATLGAYIFFLANLALLASVVATRTRTATFFTGIFLGLFLAGPYLLVATVDYFYASRGLPTPPALWLHTFLDGWQAVSPFDQVEKILRVGFASSVAGLQVGMSVAMGTACFALAWATFDFFTRGAAAEGVPAGGRHWWQRRLIWRPGRAWKRAMLWKDYHFLSGGWTGLAIRVTIYTLLAAGIAGFSGDWTRIPPVLVIDWVRVGDRMMDFGLIAMAGESMIIAAQAFRGEIDRQTLSALAMLPVSLDRQALQKVLSAALTLAPAACLYLAGIVLDWKDVSRWNDDHRLLSNVSIVGVEAAFFLGLIVFLSFRIRLLAIPLALVGGYFANVVFEIGYTAFLQRWHMDYYGNYQAMWKVRETLMIGTFLLLDLVLLWRIRVALYKSAAEN